MSDEAGRLPGTLLHKVLERVLTRRILDSVVIPTLADLQHENALVRQAPVWRRAFVRTRGYLGVWNALALCLASWPARSLREDWLGSDAVGPRLLGALTPRAGILGLVLTLGLWWPWRTGDAWACLLALPHVIIVAVPVAFLLGLVLALGRLSVRSVPFAGTRWLGPAVALSIACGLFTFGLYAWVMPQANQSYRERMVRRMSDDGLRVTAQAGIDEPRRGLSIRKGLHELSLGELQTRIREGRNAGTTTVALDVEWHKRWVIPAACLLFGPLAIGLNGLWKRPRPAIALALAFAATFLLYVALRFGEVAALGGRLGPLPAMWAGDALLALATFWLIARLPPLRVASSCDPHTS
jgi:hypothetical protein